MRRKTFWRGIYKVTEEAGELVQVLMKLAVYPDGRHPSKGNIRQNLLEEIADTLATLEYFTENNLDEDDGEFIRKRVASKLKKYREWGLSGVEL